MLAVVFAGGLVLGVAPLPQMEFVAGAATAAAPLALVPTEVVPELDHDGHGHGELDHSEDRRSGREDEVEAFDTIGVRFDEVPEDPVMVHVRDADGRWGEWNELEVNLDEGPDRTSPEAGGQSEDGVLSQPIWVDEATGYEVNLSADDAPEGDLEVAVVRPTTRRVVAEAVPLADAVVAAPFGINSRASWGARAPKSTPSIASSLKLAVVHHTASSNNYSSSQVPGILRSIQAFHMDGNGWDDIGYNFLVDKYGGLWEGRAGGTARNVVGAHAGGFNTGSVGVSVLGNYTSASPSSPALEAVSRIVGYRLQLAGVLPTNRVNFTSGGSSSIPAGRVVNLPTVVGHRDVGATSCPGSYQTRLPSIRARASDWYTATAAIATPRGGIDSVRVNGNRVDVIGWAFDPDRPGSSATVHVVLPGRLNVAVADGFRPDVGRAYGVGDNRGWGAGFSNVPDGTHRMCATVINQGEGRNKLLGCRDVVVK